MDCGAADDPRQLITRLTEIGFHQQDIGDTLYEADPEWPFRAEDE
jgi:uncharacterized protein Smg (DUF494 family)